MPPLVYRRRTHAMRLSADGDMARVEMVRPDGTRWQTSLPREAVDRGAIGNDTVFQEALGAATRASIVVPARSGLVIERLTVEVDDRSWAAIAFPIGWRGGAAVVRTSRVFPRVLQAQLAFPIRILECGGRAVVSDAIEQTFHGTYRQHALVNSFCSMASADAHVRSLGWATADVLHIHDLEPDARLLSTSVTSGGTVGWLLRFAARFQTRLLIIDSASARPRLRVAAQSIVDRGGPAVWLFGDEAVPWFELYGDLSHDRPLDWTQARIGGELFVGAGGEESLRYSRIGSRVARSDEQAAIARQLLQRMRPAVRRGPRRAVPPPDMEAVFIETAGMLRLPLADNAISHYELRGTRAERFGDLLSARLAESGLGVTGLDKAIAGARNRGKPITAEIVARHVARQSLQLGGAGRAATSRIISSKLNQMARAARTYRFEDHESDGMLPLAAKVADFRMLASALGPRRARRRREARQVQTSFAKQRLDGSLEQLPQRSARLIAAETVHFCVRIAPKDFEQLTLGDATFLEEEIRWEGEGAWMEIGVTAIDFDLFGDPVQQVWLPRNGATDYVVFAVRPRQKTTVPGVARLRVVLYHRNNVVQSFLVAARLRSDLVDPVVTLAAALNASPTDVRRLGPVAYLSRLEYATTSVAEAASAPGRGLAIVANDSAGDKVVTIKGDDLFSVTINELLPDKVRVAREALDFASRRGQAYRYLFKNHVNDGDPDELFAVLEGMARAGFDIFNTLIRDPNDQQRVPDLIDRSGGIHCAHLDPLDVVPWPVVYDRPFDPPREWFEDPLDPGAPVHKVAKGLCPASKPAADGSIAKPPCGGPGCLLNQADNEDRKKNRQPLYLPSSVICLGRFWGFLLPIEMPPVRVTGLTRQAGRPVATMIAAGQPVNVVGGFNPNLMMAKTHRETLTDTVFVAAGAATPRAKLVSPARNGPDPLRQLLQQADPDIVYFFCHALASIKDGKGLTLGPSLDFGLGHKGTVQDVLLASAFAGKAWTRAPLVFINGCSTSGFSPYVPSEFIEQFIRGRKASAVIGAEVTVWEALATEVAKTFFDAFLSGKSAGESLLTARRALLARNNPLGLVYSLYGSADLKLGAAQSPAST